MESKRVIYRAHYGELGDSGIPAVIAEMFAMYGASPEIMAAAYKAYEDKRMEHGMARLNSNLALHHHSQLLVLSIGLAGTEGTDQTEQQIIVEFALKDDQLVDVS